MSDRAGLNRGESREIPNTDRVDLGRSNQSGFVDRGRTEQVGPQSERDLHYDSPTKYDIDYYQRKVNRLEN